MSELTAASALEPDYRKGRFGATDVTIPGVVLRELHYRAIVQVELSVMRSLARSLWRWLLDAAGEFGYRVD